MSAQFYCNPAGTGFMGGLSCQTPSEGDRPFVSSPFAHSISQRLRRASENLFSASLTVSNINAEAVVAEFLVVVGEAAGASVAGEADKVQIGCSYWHTGCWRWHKRRLGFAQELGHTPEPNGPCHTCIEYSRHRSAAG
jgi:hypothetical protein